VKDLIGYLTKLPKNALWYGFQDETLIVENPADPSKYWIIDPNEDDPTGVK
jgi:hypothetical protein